MHVHSTASVGTVTSLALERETSSNGAEQHGPAGRECANAADEVRCGACSPRRCASCRARHAGVDINQVGVPVDINHIPTALLTASASTTSRPPPCCSRARRRSAWGMAWPHEVAEGQGAGRPSSAIANFSTACSTAARCSFMDMVLTMMEHGATVRC